MAGTSANLALRAAVPEDFVDSAFDKSGNCVDPEMDQSHRLRSRFVS